MYIRQSSISVCFREDIVTMSGKKYTYDFSYLYFFYTLCSSFHSIRFAKGFIQIVSKIVVYMGESIHTTNDHLQSQKGDLSLQLALNT